VVIEPLDETTERNYFSKKKIDEERKAERFQVCEIRNKITKEQSLLFIE
jgi:hypothetical protein